MKADWRAGLAAMPPGGIAVFRPAHGPRGASRVARALLEEAAILGGGQVFGFPGGDLLLGAAPGPGQRAAHAIGQLTGAPPLTWPLPDSQAEMAAQAASLAPPPRAWGLAALEAHCAQAPLREAARLTLFQSGAGGAPLAQRLGPASLDLDDPELEAMAREWLCRRLLAALTHPTGRAELPALRPGLRLILDFPLTGPQATPGGAMRAGPPNDPNGPIALLPLAVLGDPAGFARMAGALRQSGWAVGLLASDAAALEGLDVPDVTWAAPVTARPPAILPPRLILLGRPAPRLPLAEWCRAPGILHEVET